MESLKLDIDSEMKAEIIELVDGAEQIVLNLESGQIENNCFEELHRILHNLKGVSGMLEIPKLDEFIHALEQNLVHLENNPQPELFEYFLSCFDHYKLVLEQRVNLILHLANGPQMRKSNQASLGGAEPNSSLVKSDFGYEVKEDTNKKDQHSRFSSHPMAEELSRQLSGLENGKGLIYSADDDATMRKMISRYLGQAGFEVVMFNNGLELLEKAKEHKPELILTDLTMPVMNGMELVQEASSTWPQMPIIILSGSLTVEVCVESLALGVSGILQKPFSKQQLIKLAEINVSKYRSYQLLTNGIKAMGLQYSFLTEANQGELSNHDIDAVRNQVQRIYAQKAKLDQYFRKVASTN